ncbi:uncharacterized protein ACN427_013472 [Glossina fuscipes fuscipes]
MVKTSWLYSLRKEELSEICGSLDLDTKGTVEEMRKAMTALIATPDLPTEQKAKLTELEAQYTPRMLQLPEGTVRGASPKRQAQERISCGAAMDRICKWSVRYDGESCALEFIARVEELCEVYDLPIDIMPRIIMELLNGKAAIWYRNNRRAWAGWQEFRQEFLKFFLPTRYLERLDDQVRQTFQLAGEKFRDYALRLQDLMRHLDYTTQQKLDRIARNSQREYQLFFGDTSSKDLNELIAHGASQDSKRSITVEAKIGDMSFNVELLVVRRSVDHLTLGIDFLAKTGAVFIVAGHSVKLGSKNSMPTLPSELLFGTHHQDYAFGLDASGLKVEPLSTGAEHYEKLVPPPPPINQANRSVHESEVENQSNPEDNDRNRKMHKKPAITEQKIIEVKKLSSCEVERESGPTNTKKATIDVRAARTMPSSTRNKGLLFQSLSMEPMKGS